jgi:serine/threonine protein kinase
VMKIMRALTKGVIKMMPSVTTRGCQAYNDILNELVVTQALSQLHDGVILNGQPNALYRTHFFCLIHEIKVVSGNLSRTLSRSKRHKSPKPSVTIQKPTDKAVVGVKAAEAAADSAATKVEANQQQQSEQLGGLQQAAAQMAKLSSEMVDHSNGETSQEEDTPTKSAKDEELKNLPEEERMLMEALPHEYVVSVMRHDGQPLWWMMTHKKLSPQQLTSILIQVIVGLAIAENVYLYEHRDLHVSNILIKYTSSDTIPFIVDGHRYTIASHGIKATIIDATFSRMTHNGKVYYRDLTSTLRAYGTKKTPTKMSLQNRSYRQMVKLTKNKWDDFTPKTNLIWLTYLCETLMKHDIMKGDASLMAEIRKIRDHTTRVKTTFDLLGCFPKTI